MRGSTGAVETAEGVPMVSTCRTPTETTRRSVTSTVGCIAVLTTSRPFGPAAEASALASLPRCIGHDARGAGRGGTQA